MFKNIDLIGVIVLVLFFAPLFLVALSDPIGDWLNAREDRKKAAKAAKAAAEAAAADGAPPAGHPAAA